MGVGGLEEERERDVVVEPAPCLAEVDVYFVPLVGGVEGHDGFDDGGGAQVFKAEELDPEFEVGLVVDFEIEGVARFRGELFGAGECFGGLGVGHMQHGIALAGAGVFGVVLDPGENGVEVGGEGGGFEVVLAENVHHVAGLIVGVEGPLLAVGVEGAEVGDAVGREGNVVECGGLVEGVVDTEGGLATLFDNGVDTEILEGAVAEDRCGEGELERAEVGFFLVAFKITYELDGIDDGGVETGFHRRGVLCLWHDINMVQMDVGGHSGVAIERLAGAESQQG